MERIASVVVGYKNRVYWGLGPISLKTITRQ